MINFVFQIIASIFIGVCYTYLAKRYQKNQLIYFFIGFIISIVIRLIYLLVYGFFKDFKITQEYNYNKNLSVLLSIIIPYILFMILRKRLANNNGNDTDINDIGKE